MKNAIKIFSSACLMIIVLASFGVLSAPRMALAGTCLCNGTETAAGFSCTKADDCAAYGSSACTVANGKLTCDTSTGGSPSGTGTTATPGTASATPLENPLAGVCGSTTGQKCVQKVIGNVIKGALGIVGSLALLMIMWGGFQWLISMGNSDKVESGKKTLIWAVLGLVLVFGAYALTNYVITKLLNAA